MNDLVQSDKMEEVVNELVGSADTNNNVIIDGVVDSSGLITFTVPGTNLELNVAPEENNLPPGKKVSFYLPLVNVLGWIPFAFACEEISRDREIDEKSVVYVLLMENGAVKIGRTKNFNRRAKTISTSSGMKIMRKWKTENMDAEKASKIEILAHKHFKASRKLGEFFDVDFDDACKYLRELIEQEGLVTNESTL